MRFMSSLPITVSYTHLDVYKRQVYYIGVGIIEELYLRGLLQNIIEKLLKSNRNAALYAVLCTSVLFGAGHAFGAMHLPVSIIMCKILWAAALGVYFGAVYCKTRNLWVPIILHTFIDFCGIPFCFTLESEYPPLAFIASLIVYLMLGIYGIVTVSYTHLEGGIVEALTASWIEILSRRDRRPVARSKPLRLRGLK